MQVIEICLLEYEDRTRQVEAATVEVVFSKQCEKQMVCRTVCCELHCMGADR